MPYTDIDDVRIFDVTKDDSEYVWHRDNEDRFIEVYLTRKNCMGEMSVRGKVGKSLEVCISKVHGRQKLCTYKTGRPFKFNISKTGIFTKYR